MKFENFVAFRYLKSRKRNRILSFISGISIVGILLGVATLIVVVSVMSGFADNLKNKILGANSHIVVNRLDATPIKNWQEIESKILLTEDTVAASPFIMNQVLLTSRDNVSGVIIRGVKADRELKVSKIGEFMSDGDFRELSHSKTDMPSIVLGKELASNLGAMTGDEIVMVSPFGKRGPFGVTPKMKRFAVTGVFDTGMYEYNNTLAYVDLEEAQSFFGMQGAVSGFGVRVVDFDNVAPVVKNIQDTLDFPYWARDWLSMNKSLFSALKLEKYAMFIILTLIIIVASFNVVSMISVSVKDKNRDIAIMRAMGAPERSIYKIFLKQGLIIGVAGTVIGNILGLAICLIIEKYKIIELPQDVYSMDRIPVKIEWQVFALVTVCSLLITYLAGLFPARQSAKLDPIEALRRD